MKRILTGALAALLSLSALAATTIPVQSLTPTGSTAGQAIVSTGPTSVPAWGSVTATALAAQAANTVVANITASSASPTAVAIPTCNTSTSAIQYTPVTGWTCYASLATTTGTLAQFATGGAINPASTGATTPGSGSFTTLVASGGISGTGFNNLFASPPNIGAVAAATGKFTTLQATSAFTPSSTAGIVGTTTNDSANSGSVGEYVTATTASTSVTTSVTANAASISLTAGDWEVEGLVQTIPAGTTVVSGRTVGISTTSATVATAATGVSNVSSTWYSDPAGFAETILAPRTRIKLASTTTVYLVANIGFSVSTCAVAGFIRATRVR
jgi:hypothetical protein